MKEQLCALPYHLETDMPRPLILCILFLLFSLPAAAAWQETNSIRSAAEAFARSQTSDLPGKVEISVGAVDPRLQLPKCEKLEGFIPPGGKLWGNSTIGIRCDRPSAWSLYVPVTIQVIADVIVTARPLSRGTVISLQDVTRQTADLTQLPPSVLTAPEQAIGNTITNNVPSGSILRTDMLRSPLVIMQGQTVKVLTKGTGFTVSSEGKAMGNASAGQVVSVRTPTGQVISGIAKPGGVVEIPF